MPEPLRIRAVNTAADSENKIHDDRIAAQYGFRGGLVPGVTVYGYLAAAVLDRFGEDWLSRGAIDVRFQQPIYEGDEAIVTLAADPSDRDRVRVSISVHGTECASAVAWLRETHDDQPPALAVQSPLGLNPVNPPDRRTPSAETLATGTVLESLSQTLDLAQSRVSAPLDPAIVVPGIRSPENAPGRFAHPAVLLALANEIFVRNYALGPWIHSASQVRKFSAARDGEHVYTSARIVDRFERKGHEFVVLDVIIAAGIGIASGDVTAAQNDCHIVEQVRHTAIWRPRMS